MTPAVPALRSSVRDHTYSPLRSVNPTHAALILLTPLHGGTHYPHFPEKETEASVRRLLCFRSQGIRASCRAQERWHARDTPRLLWPPHWAQPGKDVSPIPQRRKGPSRFTQPERGSVKTQVCVTPQKAHRAGDYVGHPACGERGKGGSGKERVSLPQSFRPPLTAPLPSPGRASLPS